MMTAKIINGIYEACINALINNPNQNIDQLIKMIMQVNGLDSYSHSREIEILQRKIDSYFNTTQNSSHILEEQKAVPWLHTIESDEYYSNRYFEYIDKSLSKNVVTEIESTNRKILERLGNPNTDEAFRKQGLVVGNVQSGKTANYLALINLASDYGYKLIILIAGVHNNLRAQTQKRINHGFVGYDSDQQRYLGVGDTKDEESKEIIKCKQPHSLTTIQRDFDKVISKQAIVRPESASNPMIMVVKKNYRTLTNIIDWLRNREEGQRYLKCPTLIIDDEADNASINTHKNPNETTRINGQIREIVNLFKQGSYVGYTATPFANIFIDPSDYQESIANDLFPKDFIFSLDAPSTYMGATKFFLTENGEPNFDSPYIELIDDYEHLAPFEKEKKDAPITELPNSLYEAIYEFIVTILVKSNRPVSNPHTSMLINVSHKTEIQTAYSRLVGGIIDEIKRASLHHGKKPHLERIKNKHLQGIYHKYIDFSQEFDSDDDFFEKLQGIVKKLHVRLINSTSPDKLDYDNYENGLNVIAVGGYSLSRGFTLEGLTVSYLIRNTSMADTLLQMGRWFGYRDGYKDLCKLYLPEKSFSWYAFIAQSINELKDEFIVMEQNGLTPLQYGLRVRTSDTGLLITAKNKMQKSEDILLSRSYSATNYNPLTLSIENIKDQIHLYENFCCSLNVNNAYIHKDKKASKDFVLAQDIELSKVVDLLNKIDFLEDEKTSLIEFLTRYRDKLSHWDILIHKSFIDDKPHEHQKRTFALQAFLKNSVKIADGGGRILRPWEEAFGLTLEEFKKSEKQRESAKIKQSARFYRENRHKPLLALKSLTLYKSVKDKDGKKTSTKEYDQVPAFAISFPKVANSQPISYKINKVYMDTIYNPDEDEDDNEG